MSEKISTIILSAQQRLKELLSLYLSETEGFELLEDYSDFSDIYNTISSLSKCALIVDLENPSEPFHSNASSVYHADGRRSSVHRQ